MLFSRKSTDLPTADQALPGRPTPMPGIRAHADTGRSIEPPFPEGFQTLVLGMGCFWGAERIFWQTDGVWTTAVGYAGGHTPNPTYEETCSGRTGHTEVVLVVFDPKAIGLEGVLKVFWENHDPTQGMQQGNDHGTQYRSAVYWTDDSQQGQVESSRALFAASLKEARFPREITTELAPLAAFYYAEDYHQQYLHKNPNGYCGIGGTGVTCPVGLGH